ncbi:conserved Plasmodium protein, unknown function [Plasmodium vinckei brucechwatti]|uniref:MORN repeat protein n=1 Tax=Plasmodium vinckei brucechwatti TaxID=119398 RepID=A0A6V7RUA2_PLAVN|nr:conserved Plasmodium protein, unknown function [Plasmodium vinckei brucechwatti]
MMEDIIEHNECEEIGKNYTGVATVKYKNGDKFVGTFYNGERTNGKYFYSKNRTYEGSYLMGKKEGFGKLIKSSNDFYYGNFEKGKKSGFGFQKYPNGDFYYGEWKNNKKHGKGIYYFSSSKEYYSGEWCKGNFISGAWHISGNIKYLGTFFKSKPKYNGDFFFSNESKISVFYEQLFNLSRENADNENNVDLFWKYQ